MLRRRRLEIAWGAFALANLALIVWFTRWETVPFHLIWVSLTLLYGFHVWRPATTGVVLLAVMVTTGIALTVTVVRGHEHFDEVLEVPLMAAMFVAMVWHARRKLTAELQSRRFGEENARLLATQRRFLQDASHHLRTPITIALTHTELLARDLDGREPRPRGQRLGLGRRRAASP